MTNRECQRCGGNIRVMQNIAEAPELRCSSCGHEPPPPKPPSNAAALAAVAARIEPRRIKVAELYQQGVPPLTIAEQLGMTSSLVYADLKRAGLSPGKRRISSDTVRDIVAMRRAGQTNASIERTLGVSDLTVRRHTTMAGLLTPTAKLIAAKHDAFRLYRVLRPLGWSYQRIADRAGVGRATLHRWIRDAGLQQGDARTSRHRPPQATTRPRVAQSTTGPLCALDGLPGAHTPLPVDARRAHGSFGETGHHG